MILILKLDLHIFKMYCMLKIKFLALAVNKLLPEQTDTQTDLTEIITCPHTRKVNMERAYPYNSSSKLQVVNRGGSCWPVCEICRIL